MSKVNPSHLADFAQDSRVDKFFGLTDVNSVDKYLKFLNRFREFALSHQEWLSHLRHMAGLRGAITNCGTRCATASRHWIPPQLDVKTRVQVRYPCCPSCSPVKHSSRLNAPGSVSSVSISP
jgi:hypothetical protein